MDISTPIVERFASNLRLSRLRRGMTIGAAAMAIGVHRQSWVKWERGERIPPLARVEQIADSLDCSVPSLLR